MELDILKQVADEEYNKLLFIELQITKFKLLLRTNGYTRLLNKNFNNFDVVLGYDHILNIKIIRIPEMNISTVLLTDINNSIINMYYTNTLS